MIRRYSAALIAAFVVGILAMVVIYLAPWLLPHLTRGGYPSRLLILPVMVIVFLVMQLMAFEERMGIMRPPASSTTSLFGGDRASQKSLELGSTWDRANSSLEDGNSRLVKGNLDAAIRAYDEAIRLNPDDADAFNNRGWVYGVKGDDDRAIQNYNVALRLNPHVDRAHQNRAVSYFRKGHYDLAFTDFDAAFNWYRENSILLYGRGLSRWLKGEKAEGESDMLEAKRLQSDITEVMRKLGVVAPQGSDLSIELLERAHPSHTVGAEQPMVQSHGAPLEPEGSHVLMRDDAEGDRPDAPERQGAENVRTSEATSSGKP
jgi:hypothetical protein